QKLKAASDELFDMIRRKKIKVQIDQRYSLEDVGEAHQALASRKTTGATVITLE
ncbi:MAG: zinc-binding dehydrogenase, partial [Advenella sp.]